MQYSIHHTHLWYHGFIYTRLLSTPLVPRVYIHEITQSSCGFLSMRFMYINNISPLSLKLTLLNDMSLLQVTLSLICSFRGQLAFLMKAKMVPLSSTESDTINVLPWLYLAEAENMHTCTCWKCELQDFCICPVAVNVQTHVYVSIIIYMGQHSCSFQVLHV